jgi:hypothetical protein
MEGTEDAPVGRWSGRVVAASYEGPSLEPADTVVTASVTVTFALA